jgi:hypothetical protein
MRFTRSVRFDRVVLLIGCKLGRHDWIKQRATFDRRAIAPDGQFYEGYYCGWCGTGYPARSQAGAIWDEVRDR